MQELDRMEGTFEVEEEITPAGHILGVMVKKAGGDWQQLSAARLILNETIQLSVSWANDSPSHSLKGHIALRFLRPNLQEWFPVPISGQDTIVEPNGSSYVVYEVPLSQAGTWRHYEVLSGAVP